MLSEPERLLCRSKLHDESRLIQRSFDDDKGNDKKLKDQEHFMITKMKISKNQESRFKVQVPRIKIKIQDSRFKNQEKT